MITFMNGFLAVLTSSLFLHFFAIIACTASALLIDYATHYRRGE